MPPKRGQAPIPPDQERLRRTLFDLLASLSPVEVGLDTLACQWTSSRADRAKALRAAVSRASLKLLLRGMCVLDADGENLLLPVRQGASAARAPGFLCDSEVAGVFKRLKPGSEDRATLDERGILVGQFQDEEHLVFLLKFRSSFGLVAGEHDDGGARGSKVCAWVIILGLNRGKNDGPSFPYKELLIESSPARDALGRALVPFVRFAVGSLHQRVSPQLLSCLMREGDLFGVWGEPPRAGERRISPPVARRATRGCVLFLDIRKSTRLMLYTDEEKTYRHHLRKFAQVVPEIVKKHGGFYDKFTGDGAMAVFPRGWSDVSGDNVDYRIAACMAAQEIRKRCRRIFRSWQRAVACRWKGSELGLSMGLDEGQVHWEHIHGNEVTVIGKPVVLAARVCGEGDVWEILLNNRPADYINCHGLRHGFKLKEKEIRTKEFKDDPILVHSLLDDAWCSPKDCGIPSTPPDPTDQPKPSSDCGGSKCGPGTGGEPSSPRPAKSAL